MAQKEEKTLLDRIVNWGKNNPIIVFFLVFMMILSSTTDLIEKRNVWKDFLKELFPKETEIIDSLENETNAEIVDSIKITQTDDTNIESIPSVPTPSLPKPKPIKLFSSEGFKDISILYESNQKGNTDKAISKYLSAKGVSVTNSRFLNSFRQSNLYRNLESNFEALNSSDLPNLTNCICVIKEQIEFEEKERFGQAYIKADGSYTISIYNLKQQSQTDFYVETIGSGTRNSLATKSVEEHLLENEDFKNINFESCKN